MHVISTQYIKASPVTDPNRSILGREHRLCHIRGEPFAGRKRNDAVVSETVHAFGSSYPKITFLIFEKTGYGVARQAVFGAEMIKSPGVQSVDAGIGRRNPQRAFAVDEKVHSVRMGNARQQILFYDVMSDSEQAEALRRKYSPNRPVGGNCYAFDSRKSAGGFEFLFEVGFKGTVTPPHKLTGAPDPEISLQVFGKCFCV
jgi:hypothetical protein